MNGSGVKPAVETRALAGLCPGRFGFGADGERWTKEVAGLGPMTIAPLSWQHARASSYDRVAGERVPMNALRFVVALQQQTWGMPLEELVPVNLLAVLRETGGAILVAYDPRLGFNADGWLGFVFGAGARSGVLVSHMLGVRPDRRGAHGIGWSLKVVQAYEAVRAGHTAMTWTFDPMRGANARLNIEKLGAIVTSFTVDKYGPLRSELYGDVPTDRLVARWNLLDPGVSARLDAVHDGRHAPMTEQALAEVPEITTDALARLRQEQPSRLRYGIPADVDDLAARDPDAVAGWRRSVREALAAFLPTAEAATARAETEHLAAVRVCERAGAYAITRFAAGHDTTGDRRHFYILERTNG